VDFPAVDSFKGEQVGDHVELALNVLQYEAALVLCEECPDLPRHLEVGPMSFPLDIQTGGVV
jgi:hypothetical protein